MGRLSACLALTTTCVSALLAAETFAQDPAKPDQAAGRHFDRNVAPLLAGYCLDCHAGQEPQGGLNLARRPSAMAGGESGPVIVAGRPSESLLWHRIESDEMPPKQPLPADAKRVLRRWIEQGAVWGSDPIDPFRLTTAERAGVDWWSLQPLDPVEPPAVQATARVRNPIDRFLLARLEAEGLTYSDDAPPAAQVRRLYFDLVGLPPEPEVVRDFRRDPSEAAYAALVDSVLDNPAFGERWGRHWLDVARFGESDGFERNHPRTNLWPYRDWVIQAFNDDLPYDQFVRMQIAGDVLTGNAPEGLAAVGFLVAGVHNTVVGSSEMMKRVARQDELEEITGTIGQTFLGLTVHCARCHDHKFDPIRQREYYQLTAAIAGVNHGEREVRSEEVERELAGVARRLEDLAKRLQAIDGPARKRILALREAGRTDPPKRPAAFGCWEFDENLNDSRGTLHGKAVAGARLEGGALLVDGRGYVETPPLPQRIVAKTLEAWVLLDNLDQRGGAAISLQTTDGDSFDAIVFGEREPRRWMAGSDNFRRTQSFGGPAEDEAAARPDQVAPVQVAIVYEADGTIRGYRNGRPYGKPYKSSGPRAFEKGTANVVFGLRHAPPGGNRLLQGRILRAKLYDRALSPEAIAASAGVGSEFVAESEIVAHLQPDRRAARRQLIRQRSELVARREELQNAARRKIYTVQPATPKPTHFLPRGDVMHRGPVVEPDGLAGITGVPADFELPADAPDADRRRALADWLTHPDNPLPARVIVNRLWHYHFGVGLVETPNDFGFNGGHPSHAKLLDWLAGELIRNDYRLKPIHRLMVTSSAYRQASRANAEAARIDAANRLLWRRAPRRMEAEVLRDTLLQLSGKLNLERGGPGFVDVEIQLNNGTTYYTPLDREDEQLNRRTVYRFWPRGGRSALLDTFDCPDPSTTAPRRSVTTTPLQALSLLNNPFVLRMVDHFAARVLQEAGDDPQSQVTRAYELVYSRRPDDEELRLATRLVADHGLPALARALFNSNELVVIE